VEFGGELGELIKGIMSPDSAKTLCYESIYKTFGIIVVKVNNIFFLLVAFGNKLALDGLVSVYKREEV
jgi:hypothetical protein